MGLTASLASSAQRTIINGSCQPPPPPVPASLNHEPRTPFRFEHEMLRPVISRIPEMFHVTPGQRLRVLQETAIGSVVPDVLLGVWSGELPHWNGLNSISRHILAWLMVWKTANSEEQLQRDLFLSEHATTSAITALKRVGAITSRDSGEVALLPGLEVWICPTCSDRNEVEAMARCPAASHGLP